MPLRTIVVVVLRIYTIIMVVQGLVQFAMALPILASLPDLSEVLALSFISPIMLIVLGVILWLATLPFASLVIKGHDVSIDAITLKKEDLYNFAFVFLGVYFVLAYISSTVENGYKFFLYDFNSAPDSGQKGRFLVPFAADIVTLVFGFAAALGAPRWTRKLLQRENE